MHQKTKRNIYNYRTHTSPWFMISENFLKEMGFTQYEIKIFLAMLGGAATASHIARTADIPSNKVYESLSNLEKKGFVATLGLIPKKYKMTGIEKFRELVSEKEKILENLQQGIKKFEKILSEPVLTSTENIALVLQGKEKIIRKLDEITPQLKVYQYNLGGNLIFSYKGGRLVRDAIKRGVDFRFLIHNDPSRKEIYRKWSAIGVKIRFYAKEEHMSIRFSSFDGKIARITIGKPQIEKEENYLTFWIESPAFALLLKDQFLEMWKKAREFMNN